MADFNLYFNTLLRHEGGFVNDPEDPGGATNRGITLNTFQQHAKSLFNKEPTLENLRDMTVEEAAKLYKHVYWDKIGCDTIADQPLAEIVFDSYVNTGRNAIRILQRTLNELDHTPPLEVNGNINLSTLDAFRKANAWQLYEQFKAARIRYYQELVKRKPSLKKFLKGWIRRVESFPDR